MVDHEVHEKVMKSIEMMERDWMEEESGVCTEKGRAHPPTWPRIRKTLQSPIIRSAVPTPL
jgi:hypothetical protein